MKKILFVLLLAAMVCVQAVEIMPASFTCYHNANATCSLLSADYLSGSLSNPTFVFTEYDGSRGAAVLVVDTVPIVVYELAGIRGGAEYIQDARITENDDTYFITVSYFTGGVGVGGYVNLIAVDKATKSVAVLTAIQAGGAGAPTVIYGVSIDYNANSNLIYLLVGNNDVNTVISAYYVNGTIYQAYNSTDFGTGYYQNSLTHNGSAALTMFGDDLIIKRSLRNPYIPLNALGAAEIIYNPAGSAIIIADFLNETHVIAVTNMAGQFDLWYGEYNCPTGCVPVRLTSTAADEGFWKSPDGGALAYSISAGTSGANPVVFYNSSDALEGKYLCDNNELADSCEGAASYGDAPASAQFVAIDRARCMNSNPAECAANIDIVEFGLYGNTDWLVIQYKINDKIALPSIYTAGTSPSNDYTYANASCVYSSNGIDWTEMNWGLNTSSAYYTAWESEISAFVSDSITSLAENNIYIKCTSDNYGSEATLSSRFIVENTYPVQTDYYVAIGDENGYSFVLSENSNYLRFKITRSGSTWSPYVLVSEWSLLGTSAFGGFYESTTNPLTYLSNQNLVPSNIFAGYGYHRFRIDSRSLVATTRFPTFVRIQPILYESSCDEYKDTTILSSHLQHYFYGGDFGGATTFEVGEDAIIGYTVAVGENSWDLLGTDLPFNEHTNIGYFSAGLYLPYSLCHIEYYNSTDYVAGMPNWTYDLDNLIVGEYTAVITCEENALNTRSYLDCIGLDSYNYSFNVTANAGCAQTKDDCGVGGNCTACGTVTLECESGNYTMQSECRYNACDATALECPPATVVYGIDISNNNELSCISAQESNLIRVGLTKFGAPDAWGSVTSPSCNLYLEGAGVEDYFEPMTYNALSNSFEVNLAGEGLQCDSTYYLTAICSSSDFDSSKMAYGAFNILYADYCNYGNYFVPLGDCVTTITEKSADLPLYCNAAGNIVNNSVTCGCPQGSAVNATSGECDNAAMGAFLAGFYDFPWLSLGGILLILVFGGLFFVFLKVTKDEGGNIIVIKR